MKGWKTWTGVVGLVMVAVSTKYLGVDMEAAGAVSSDIVNLIDIASKLFVTVGIAHKIEKLGKTIKAK